MLVEILEILSLMLVLLISVYLVRHFVFTLAVLINAQRHEKMNPKQKAACTPHVSILIPAHNEVEVIGRILQRMTELTYPKEKLQIIVIDDASTDGTGGIAEEYSKVCSCFEVIRRPVGKGGKGKAAALNFARVRAVGEFLFFFDADYYPQIDILQKLVKEFADPQVGAVQGRVTVLNEPSSLVTRLVTLERIGGYRVDQQARNDLGLIPQFGGTVGGIRRDLLEHLGGFNESILAEDTELTFRVYLAGYKIRYVNDAESYEEAVENWHAYWRQRYRWAKGHMQVSFRHSVSVLKSRKLGFKEKLDGLLLLNVYFMPVLVLFSWFLGVPIFFLHGSFYSKMLWALVPFSLYSFVGNFAPFFEVGVGVYLDGRKRTHWLLSFLIFAFFFNILICTKALWDLILSRLYCMNEECWRKTLHSGNGNSYITIHDKIPTR